jgi:hypothetical protein
MRKVFGAGLKSRTQKPLSDCYKGNAENPSEAGDASVLTSDFSLWEKLFAFSHRMKAFSSLEAEVKFVVKYGKMFALVQERETYPQCGGKSAIETTLGRYDYALCAKVVSLGT